MPYAATILIYFLPNFTILPHKENCHHKFLSVNICIISEALSFCSPSPPGFSSPGREATESTVSQQLSVGDDSLGSWSNLSFEDEHPDDNSSFLHLSDRYAAASFLIHSEHSIKTSSYM